MGFYDRLAQSAKRRLSGNGRDVLLRQVTAGKYSPDTHEITGRRLTDISVKAVISDYSEFQQDGEIVQRGDKRVLIAAAALENAPQLVDLIIDGETVYKIVNIKTIQPGDVPLLYRMQVRK